MSQQQHLKEVLVLKSDPQQVTKVETFIETVCKRLHLDESQFNKILVATTEAVNNGIIHGNKRDPKKKVTLICEFVQKIFTVTVEDEGPGINPEALPDPLAEENILRENGRGVFLMRSLMDEVEFVQTKNGSAVVMRIKVE